MDTTIELKGSYEATEVYSLDPLVGVRNNVISPIECLYLIELSKPHIKRAGVVLDDGHKPSAGRTGSNHWLKYDEDDVVMSIGQRIADIVGLPLENAESMQVIHYGPDQEYRPHFDAFNLSLPKGQRAAKWGGQRLVTALVYLNNVEAGGATHFPKLGITVPALPGRMVIFHNTTDDISNAHPLSLHAGMPVESGEKWAFNMWFRAQDTTESFDPAQPLPGIAFGNRLTNDSESASPQPLPPLGSSGHGTGQKDSTIIISGNSAEASIDDICVMANRADAIWQRAVSRHKVKSQQDERPGLFVSYWDTYGKKPQPLPPENWQGHYLKTLSRESLNPLSDLNHVAQTLREMGLAQLTPSTFGSIDEAINVSSSDDELWFVRSTFKNNKDKTLCIPRNVLTHAQLPEGRVIQKAVDQLMLIQQRKFTVRVYLVVINGEIYCAQDTVLFIHGETYSPNDPNFAAQVDNQSYRDDGSTIRLVVGSESPHSEAIAKSARELAKKLGGLLNQIRNESTDHAFAVLALDTLLTKANEMKLLRIHTFPNFITTAEIDSTVHVPLFEDILKIMVDTQPSNLTLITN